MVSILLRRSLLACLAAVAALGPIAQTQARPITPLENRDMPYSTDMPPCDSPYVLGLISSNFAARESEYWNSGLSLSGFDKIVEIGYRSAGLDYLAKRFCTAQGVFSDGRPRNISYAIDADQGWLGVAGVAVDWCVEGLDRQLAYGNKCRAARP